jgi:hypothetical protein
MEELNKFFDVNSDGPYMVLSDKDNKNQCLVISFRDNVHTIFIHDLDKCGFTGTESLNILYDFAKKNPAITKIEMADGSRITQCGTSISLSILKILTNGESWYNSLGYKSVNYDAEKEHNAKIIDIKFVDFLNLCIENHADKYKKSITDFDYDTFETMKSRYRPEYIKEMETNEKIKNDPEALNAKIQEFKKNHFEKYMNLEKWKGTNPEMPVRVFFNIINDKLKSDKLNNGCDPVAYEWLRDIIDFIQYSDVLLYSATLIKSVVKKGGKRKRKSKKQKGKKTKHTLKSNKK